MHFVGRKEAFAELIKWYGSGNVGLYFQYWEWRITCGQECVFGYMFKANRYYELIQRLLRSAVFLGGALVVLRTVGFFGVMAYALRVLSSEDMGLWQLYFALIGGAAIVEMGFSLTVGRFASYFMGGAVTIPRVGLAPVSSGIAAPNYAGVMGLIAMARRLYAVLAVLMVVLSVAGWIGWCIFKKHPWSCQEWSLFGVYAAGAGANMAGMFWMGVLFGLNRVREVQLIQLAGLAISYLATAIGLRLGCGLWALVLGQLILNAIPRWWARVLVLKVLPGTSMGGGAIAFRDVWSMTWRTGLVTAGGFLMCQATALGYSLWVELDEMASYGLTLQMVLLLRSMGDLWLLVKLPWIGMALAGGNIGRIQSVFVERTILAGLTYGVGCVGLMVLGPFLLDVMGSQTPLSGTGIVLLIVVLLGADMLPGCHSALLLSLNCAPHAVWYLVTGLISVSLGAVLGWLWGGAGVLVAPLLCGAVWLYWRVPSAAWAVLRGFPRCMRESSSPNSLTCVTR